MSLVYETGDDVILITKHTHTNIKSVNAIIVNKWYTDLLIHTNKQILLRDEPRFATVLPTIQQIQLQQQLKTCQCV